MISRHAGLLTPILLTAAACASLTPESMPVGPEHVTGTITYRERIALPPNAVVQVKLLEISRPDTPAATVAQQIIANPGEVPIAFDLTYGPAAIDSRNIYGIQVRITVEGELQWTNDTSHAVITHGNPSWAEIVLRQVR